MYFFLHIEKHTYSKLELVDNIKQFFLLSFYLHSPTRILRPEHISFFLSKRSCAKGISHAAWCKSWSQHSITVFLVYDSHTLANRQF